MMIPIDKFPENKKYLGNKDPDNMEVHDLENERPQCQIDKIINADHAVVFKPDTIKEAHKNGYDNCAYCIGNSKR